MSIKFDVRDLAIMLAKSFVHYTGGVAILGVFRYSQFITFMPFARTRVAFYSSEN
ncbi:hypothetical protein KEJ15_06220 [Candidatus Bathyarchaeota archaeon]|nr:hypothetical protein [Candidatus Bathyarchaeota archaeon]